MNTTANLLEPLTIANAPAASKPILEGVQKAFGFIPNLMAVFANSPEMLKGYLALEAEWNKTSFTPQERTLALLAASLENECGYCIAAHSTVAKAFLKVSAETVAQHPCRRIHRRQEDGCPDYPCPGTCWKARSRES